MEKMLKEYPKKWVEQASMWGNRLLKNKRHLRKWARREGVMCYRLYDRDIPELPFAVDWYDGHLHIAVYGWSEDESEEEYVAWLGVLLEHIGRILEVPAERVFLKCREKQKGLSQYTVFSKEGQRMIVKEGGHQFWVNLSDYLDTGLFLDHRPTRKMVELEASGKRFLNLFSYTGAFTVYAAAGGARMSTSVDLSKTYLAWAKDNLSLNGFDLGVHQLHHGDVFAFLQKAKQQKKCYDLVVLDPPTFSNSKRMEGCSISKETMCRSSTMFFRSWRPVGSCIFRIIFENFVWMRHKSLVKSKKFPIVAYLRIFGTEKFIDVGACPKHDRGYIEFCTDCCRGFGFRIGMTNS